MEDSYFPWWNQKTRTSLKYHLLKIIRNRFICICLLRTHWRALKYRCSINRPVNLFFLFDCSLFCGWNCSCSCPIAFEYQVGSLFSSISMQKCWTQLSDLTLLFPTPQLIYELSGNLVCWSASQSIFDKIDLLFSGFPFGQTYNSSQESFMAKGMFFTCHL